MKITGMCLASHSRTASQNIGVQLMQQQRLTCIWIWINNRQNLRWSITSMSVLCCLWHGVQLCLECRDSVCVHCRLKQRIPLWDCSYKEGVLVLLSIGRCDGTCSHVGCGFVHLLLSGCHPLVLLFTLHYLKEKSQSNLASPFLQRLPL